MRTALVCAGMALFLAACALSGLSGEQRLVTGRDGGQVRVSGLAPVESEGDNSWRWGLGPATVVAFTLEEETKVEVSVDMRSPMGGNSVAVEHGRRLVDTVHFTGPGQWAGKWVLACPKGENTVTFRYQRWNGQGARYMVEDDRPLAVAFYRLSIRPMPLARGGLMAVAANQ